MKEREGLNVKEKKRNNKLKREKRLPTLLEALIPLIAMFAILFYGKGIMGWQTEPLLIIIAALAMLIAIRVGCTWEELLEEISIKIGKGMPAILILITVGALVGTWRASGTVPIMIYYGIQLVSPKFLLVTAFIVTAIVSIATGTSWGSVGTIGVALMGIASGLGVSLPATAGAVIAGSFFGDKMSPLSETTNLAPLVAGGELYAHIKHMLWTTIPASIVSLLVYGIVGFNTELVSENSSDKVSMMLNTLDSVYEWSWLLFIPVLIVLVGSVLKFPTIPVMLVSSAFAGAIGCIVQNISIADMLKCTVAGFDVSMINAEGFDVSTAPYEVTRLINGGGMESMTSTLLLIFCAYCFAGIMSKAGCLDVILAKLLSTVKSVGGLITSTVVSCVTIALTTGNSYLSLIIPGEMFQEAYRKKGLAAENLSRTLEDAGTVVVPLIPWSAAGAYMTATLGVETFEYLPWAILCYTGFIFAIIYGFTGIGIKKITPDELEK